MSAPSPSSTQLLNQFNELTCAIVNHHVDKALEQFKDPQFKLRVSSTSSTIEYRLGDDYRQPGIYYFEIDLHSMPYLGDTLLTPNSHVDPDEYIKTLLDAWKHENTKGLKKNLILNPRTLQRQINRVKTLPAGDRRRWVPLYVGRSKNLTKSIIEQFGPNRLPSSMQLNPLSFSILKGAEVRLALFKMPHFSSELEYSIMKHIEARVYKELKPFVEHPQQHIKKKETKGS